jgi:hypothetical protein
MIHIEDYELEAHKDLVYLQEEKELFYRSLTDPGKIEIEIFMSNKQYVFDMEAFEQLQHTAKLNQCIPASIIVKADKRLLGNYERNVKSLSFRRTS